MTDSWKVNFLLVCIACLMKFSAEDKTSGKFEPQLQLENSETEEDLLNELITAVKKVDTETALMLVMEGALKGYDQGIYNSSEEIRLEKIKNKLKIIGYLMKWGITVLPSEKYPKTNYSDGQLFNVTLVPATDLFVTLLVNLTAVKTWTNETLIRSGKIPLFLICALPDVPRGTIKLVLDAGTDIDVKDNSNITALMVATALGNIDTVKFLVENGANVNNAAFVTSISTSSSGLRYDLLRVFTRKNTTVPTTIIPASAIFLAANSDHPEILKYLLQNGADVNGKGQSCLALYNVAVLGKMEIMEILLENGIDVNGKDLLGATALHKVAEKGNVKTAKLLIEYGADPNAADRFEWTPLHVAALFSRNATKAMIELLLDSGSNINAATDGGYSPLNLAEAGHNLRFLGYLVGKFHVLNSTIAHIGLEERDSDEGHAEIIRLLLDRGANMNHQDDILGWTTLHWATASGDLRVTRILLEKYGAAFYSSKMGLTPFGTAKHFGRKCVFEYFNTTRNLV